MLIRPASTWCPPTASTRPDPTASTMSATGAHRDSTVTARRLRVEQRAVAAAERRRATLRCGRRPGSPARCGRRSAARAANRPDSARACCCALRTRRRWRTAKTASTGTTSSAITPSDGLMASRMRHHHDQADRVGQQGRRDGDQRVEQPPDIGRQPRDDLARAHPVVPAQREGDGVVEHVLPQPGPDPLGRPLGRDRGHHVDQPGRRAEGDDRHGGQPQQRRRPTGRRGCGRRSRSRWPAPSATGGRARARPPAPRAASPRRAGGARPGRRGRQRGGRG